MNDKFSLLKKMRRLSGILVHPTSLPGKFGVGDLGPEAYRFVDFLQEAGQHLWQTLPLGPTGGHNSPYQCFSSFAGGRRGFEGQNRHAELHVPATRAPE